MSRNQGWVADAKPENLRVVPWGLFALLLPLCAICVCVFLPAFIVLECQTACWSLLDHMLIVSAKD